MNNKTWQKEGSEDKPKDGGQLIHLIESLRWRTVSGVTEGC